MSENLPKPVQSETEEPAPDPRMEGCPRCLGHGYTDARQPPTWGEPIPSWAREVCCDCGGSGYLLSSRE